MSRARAPAPHRIPPKIESSEVMWGGFVSASSSRLDPCSTCSRCFPCGAAARDLRSGSGLTANRINLPYASELYPAFNSSSRSPRPALCYRPLPALLLSPFCNVQKVTGFEPRTPHQPEKLKKLSKNECVYRTSPGSRQQKVAASNCLSFQSSARRPQPRDRIWCSPALANPAEAASHAAWRAAASRPG